MKRFISTIRDYREEFFQIIFASMQQMSVICFQKIAKNQHICIFKFRPSAKVKSKPIKTEFLEKSPGKRNNYQDYNLANILFLQRQLMHLVRLRFAEHLFEYMHLELEDEIGLVLIQFDLLKQDYSKILYVHNLVLVFILLLSNADYISQTILQGLRLKSGYTRLM